MANIVLTNKCNLSCSYCFAKEITDTKAQYINVENFQKAVNFIKTGRNERLGIVGGEPSIHPEFGTFLNMIAKDDEINDCIIFTNGTNLENYIDLLLHPKFNFLINCNPPYIIGNLYNRLEKNIKLLHERKKEDFKLGINIYKTNLDYSYIFKLLETANKKELRISISISNEIKENCENVLNYLEKFNPVLLNLYNDCIKKEIIPYFDCSGIPPCVMSTGLKKAILKAGEIRKKEAGNVNIFGHECGLQADILPDLSAVRSICFPCYEKVSINNFNQ